MKMATTKINYKVQIDQNCYIKFNLRMTITKYANEKHLSEYGILHLMGIEKLNHTLKTTT